ncbi:MAG: CPBP family intramembrane metalloprotease [Bacteroidales bacterium]|nr:CPBP family intramembrane metalloprotease [Bacteroidales bacterium]
MNPLPAFTELFCFTSAILVASLGFIFYYYFPDSTFIQKMLKSAKGESHYVFFQRFLGVFIFGIIPLLVIVFSGTSNLADFGLIAPVPETYFWTIILSAAIVAMNYFNSGTPANLSVYPQIRKEVWSIKLIILSLLSWIAYLLSYEFLFRGFLFFASVRLLGLWPATAINIAVYALVHVPKGIRETVGAIPLGILLCYLTFRTGSIWIAVFTHIVMAVSNEWFSLRAHPQMSIKLKGK